MSRLITLALLTLTLLGCGGAESIDDAIASLQGSYDAGEYEAVASEAPALAERAAGEGATDVTVWRIHKLHLQALAQDGRGDDVAAAMGALPEAQAKQVDASLYQMLGQYVANAGEALQAVSVLEQALEKYPEKKPVFDPMIQQLAESSDEAKERLKSLGYL